MTGTRKREQIDRLDLLYDPTILMHCVDEYGAKETEIKRHVKTTAKEYEIRTALRYWLGGTPTHRTSDAVWKRLRLHDVEQIPPQECERI